MAITSDEFKSMDLVPDGDGGFRVKTREEKESGMSMGVNPTTLKKQWQITTHMLDRAIKEADGMNLSLNTMFKAADVKLPQFRSFTLKLFGEPMPKQSVRSFATGAKTASNKYIVKHYQPAEMDKRVKDYQRQIREQLPQDFVMFTKIVHVRKLHFIFSPLKAFHKIKGKMEAIRGGEIFYKTTKPDLPDNLKKLVNDSMSNLIYKDDSLIVTENDVAKYYGEGGCIIIHLEGY